MLNKIKRWFGSKSGKNTIIIVLSIALVISILGQAVGWSNLGRLVTGTAGPGAAEFSCLPTCFDGRTDYNRDGTPEPQDGKFLSMPGSDMASFGGATIVVWVNVPEWKSSFDLGIFDGDSGKDSTGAINTRGGNWDETEDELTYTLYADPNKDGSGMTVVGQWRSNTDPMPNNDWYNVTINNVPAAQRGTNGNYYYRLVTTRSAVNYGISAFKLRSTGQLSTGRSELVDANFAIVGMMATLGDIKILYPNFDPATGDWNNPGPSTYDGEWWFYFDVPAGTKTITFWDGDFDRGTGPTVAEGGDTDDVNTPPLPPFAASYPSVNPEGAAGQGNPADDAAYALYKREPPAWYEILGPDNQPIFRNEEPSGTEEWEKFTVSSDPDLADSEIDLRVDSIPSGPYTLHIAGLDVHNTVWFRLNYDLGDQHPPCPDCPICSECQVCETCSCAAPTPTPTPEPTATPEPPPLPAPEVCSSTVPIDLLYVLDVSGSMGMLYPGSGSKIDAAKQSIQTLNDWLAQQNNGSRVALITFHGPGQGSGQPPLYPPDVRVVSGFTADIAAFNATLQGLNVSGSTPTAHALNQVTNWLPGAATAGHLPVVILVSDGVPTVDLQQYGFQDADVQAVSLYDASGNFLTADQVRASGKLYSSYNQRAGETLADTMMAMQNLKAVIPNITVESIAIQATQEGIFNDDILRYVAAQGNGQFFMAEDAAQLTIAFQWAYVDSACGTTPPAQPTPTPTPVPSGCTNPRVNNYSVENTTNNPFYSIKFNYSSGTEIKNGLFDEFQFTLTSAQAAAATSFKLQAKAGRATGTATITGCAFNGTQPCASVSDNNFTFTFMGAKDNGNGTMTLTFRVKNDRTNGLSHVAIGLPSGVVPSSPTNGNYQSSVCP